MKFIHRRILAFVVIACIAWILYLDISKRKKEETAEQPQVTQQSNSVRRPLSSESLCYKRNAFDTFRICDRLPFTSTECGNAVPGKSNQNVVPNVVHFVWSGNRTLKFYEYLSIRAAAAIQKPEAIMFHYDDMKPIGHLWTRIEREVSCLRMVKIKKPMSFYGQEIVIDRHRSDVARSRILLENGGIYLDADAIVLRPLDPLRKYSATMGRSITATLSSGVILAEPNSSFLLEWFNSYSYKYKEQSLQEFFTAESMRVHIRRPDLPLHIEETSIQRPNPLIKEEARMMHESFNISKNYVFHIHPGRTLKNDQYIENVNENQLRFIDTTYGAAARAALFGTQDLIYLDTEESIAQNRADAKEIKELKPL